MKNLLVLTFLSIICRCYTFSNGAPEMVCDHMMPIHLALPQGSKLPYHVSVNKNEIKGGETVDIEISGGKFKGLLMEVRKGNRAKGEFILDEDENDFKTINCHGVQDSGLTHQNNANKKNTTLIWKAPKTPGKYIVYLTIAKDGFVFWTRKRTEEITVV